MINMVLKTGGLQNMAWPPVFYGGDFVYQLLLLFLRLRPLYWFCLR